MQVYWRVIQNQSPKQANDQNTGKHSKQQETQAMDIQGAGKESKTRDTGNKCNAQKFS